MNASVSRLVCEALGAEFPGPSQDPADYDIDARQVQQTLFYLKQRFVQQYGEEQWEASLPRFQQALLSKDPAVGAKMRGIYRYNPLPRDYAAPGVSGAASPEELGRGLEQQALDTDPEHRMDRAMRDEPSLRRGESLVLKVIGKVNG
jgi:hypothetical protein